MKLELGELYRTRGGWTARIIWIFKFDPTGEPDQSVVLAIHRPGEISYERIVHHKLNGKAAGGDFTVNAPPVYDVGHPADLIELMLPE
jgi:hypothetical protein